MSKPTDRLSRIWWSIINWWSIRRSLKRGLDTYRHHDGTIRAARDIQEGSTILMTLNDYRRIEKQDKP